MQADPHETFLPDVRHVPVKHLCVVLKKAESVGLSSTKLLRQCRLSYNLHDLLVDHIDRVSVNEFVSIRRICIDGIRGRLAAPDGIMSSDDFEFMCHSLITSMTLREMIGRLARFLEIGGRRAGWCSLTVSGDRAALEFHLGPTEIGWEIFFAINAFFVFSRMFEWATGERLNAAFETRCAATPENLALVRTYGRQVAFGADGHRMSFAAALLDSAIVRTPADLRLFLKGSPFDIVAPMSTPAPLSKRVAGLYRNAMLTSQPMPTIAELSNRLRLANATLRRHLEREGHSIRSIKEDVRASAARELLAGSARPIGHVADMLGFSSLKAFTRAFRGWTGMTPAVFRSSGGVAAEGGPTPLG